MKQRFDRVAAALVAVILVPSLAVPRTATTQEMSEQDKKMMELMQKYGAPGEPHKLLARYAGEWDLDVTNWPKPGAERGKSRGTMKNKVIFDGRYVQCRYDATMGGMRFSGLEIIGYDLLQKKYNTFWIDSLGTGFSLTSGALDATGTVLTETGAYPDVMTEGKTMQKVKNVTTFLPDGSFRFEMFMVMPGGEEAKWMEIVAKKKTM